MQAPTPATTSVTPPVTAAAAGNASGSSVTPSSTPVVTSPVTATKVTTARPASTLVQAQPRPASANVTRSRATKGVHVRSVAAPIKKAQRFKCTVNDKSFLLSSDAKMSPLPGMTETRVEQERLKETARGGTFSVSPTRDSAKPSASDEPAVGKRDSFFGYDPFLCDEISTGFGGSHTSRLTPTGCAGVSVGERLFGIRSPPRQFVLA